MSRLERQSFLGADSDEILKNATVGFIGLGGGGSHLVQQSAHLGVGGYVLVDPDSIDERNTNRLVGGTLKDVATSEKKVDIARRVIYGLNPDARVKPIYGEWQKALDELRECDVIMGAVDSFLGRDELERFCRRFMIPYIDIGMDVYDLGDPEQFLISGQVILSSPGRPCMRCCQFLTDKRLQQEAARYGDVGGRAQVVWPNGVLASTAVGLLVQMLSPWHPRTTDFAYLVYDGNRSIVTQSPYVLSLQNTQCPHFPSDEVGDPAFDVRQSGRSRRTQADVAASPAIGEQQTWLTRMRRWISPRR